MAPVVGYGAAAADSQADWMRLCCCRRGSGTDGGGTHSTQGRCRHFDVVVAVVAGGVEAGTVAVVYGDRVAVAAVVVAVDDAVAGVDGVGEGAACGDAAGGS